MAKLAKEKGIGLLAYGTLLGGFFSDKYLNTPPPSSFETVSQQKVTSHRIDDVVGQVHCFTLQEY